MQIGSRGEGQFSYRLERERGGCYILVFLFLRRLYSCSGISGFDGFSARELSLSLYSVYAIAEEFECN